MRRSSAGADAHLAARLSSFSRYPPPPHHPPQITRVGTWAFWRPFFVPLVCVLPLDYGRISARGPILVHFDANLTSL
jgi:hypothetical protein